MSQRSARTTTRQIRRAFGPEALDTINQQGETLTSVVLPRLMTLGKTAQSVDRRLEALERRASDAAVTLAPLSDVRFLARLRWLVGL